MKEYPSFCGEIINTKIYAFDKLDGSQVRAVWSRKKNEFYAFGSRHARIDETSEILGEAIPIIKTKYEKELNDLFNKERYQEVTCFFEFYGNNSFAGVHNPTESHTVTLFDVFINKKEFIHPNEFVKKFEHLDTPNLVFHGNPNATFIQEVKNGTLEGISFEGVVCKGSPLKKGYPPLMFKIKTIEWVKKVKSLYKDEQKLKELL